MTDKALSLVRLCSKKKETFRRSASGGSLINWMISLPFSNDSRLGQNEIAGHIIKRRANTDLTTQTKSIIEVSQVQQVKESCLCQINIASSLGLQETKQFFFARCCLGKILGGAPQSVTTNSESGDGKMKWMQEPSIKLIGEGHRMSGVQHCARVHPHGFFVFIAQSNER